jgi:hypothetical protein
MTVRYKARNGNLQYKPSLTQLENMERDMRGFCLACGRTAAGKEPDTRKDTCEHCGKPKVFGPGSLIEMGLFHYQKES